MKPQKIYTDQEKRLIVSLYEIGHTDERVAQILGIVPTTMRKQFNYNTTSEKDPTPLSVTIKKVKGTADDKVVETLYQRALGGDVGAICFWLKNRQPDKWKEKRDIDFTKLVLNNAKIIAVFQKMGIITPKQQGELVRAIELELSSGEPKAEATK